MAKQTIGEFLATQRKAKGYTQQEVADRLGISNRTLSSWEQGRAYPDILTLPALAEIYGVTADEILNGERALNPLDGTELSGRAYDNVKKRIFAKYCTRVAALTGGGIACAALMLLIALIGNSAPAWLIITACVIAVMGTIAVCTLLFVFDKSACAALGIYSVEEFSDDSKKYLWNLRKTAAGCLETTGLCWLADAVITILTFVFEYGTPTVLGYALIVIPLITSAAMLVAAAVVFRKNFNNYAPETEKTAYKIIKKKRGKLLLKTSLFSLIPIALCAVALIVGANVRYYFSNWGYGAEHKTFLRVMHTVMIPDNPVVAEEAQGSHYIDFESLLSTPSNDGKYNFEGLEIVIECNDKGETEGCAVRVADAEGNIVFMTYGKRIPVDNSDELIFDLANKRVTVSVYSEGEVYHEGDRIAVDNGYYQIICEYSSTHFYDVLPVAVAGIVASVAVATVIYLVLRRNV